MQIGIVARKIGLSVDAIRFYERNALLPHASRTAGGFLRFGESEIETLPFIRRVQGLGFTLNEVREWRSAAATKSCINNLPAVSSLISRLISNS